MLAHVPCPNQPLVFDNVNASLTTPIIRVWIAYPSWLRRSIPGSLR